MWENKYEQKWCLFGGTARLHTKTGLVRTVRIQRFTIRNVKKKKKRKTVLELISSVLCWEHSVLPKKREYQKPIGATLALKWVWLLLWLVSHWRSWLWEHAASVLRKKKLHVNFSEMGSGKNQCWLKLKSYNSSSTVLCRLHFANTQERAWGSDP